jgi:diketogulonate reductase-like aldo/keto reductase
MERAVQAGKVKSLGLSNFSQAQIQEILDVAAIRPAVLQVEAHPYFPQTQLKTFLASFGAVVMAWYPLGHGDKALLEEPVLTQLAQKYSKTPAQVLLRWHTQVGNIVIPGSKNEDHIKDNIALYDFTLAPQDLAAIAALDKNTPYYVASDEALQGYLAFAPNFDAQD